MQMMHDDVMLMQKEKQTISNWEKSRGVTIDTTNKGSRPAILAETTRREVNYRVFRLREELLDTTNKGLLLHLEILDTTNKKF